MSGRILSFPGYGDICPLFDPVKEQDVFRIRGSKSQVQAVGIIRLCLKVCAFRAVIKPCHRIRCESCGIGALDVFGDKFAPLRRVIRNGCGTGAVSHEICRVPVSVKVKGIGTDGRAINAVKARVMRHKE